MAKRKEVVVTTFSPSGRAIKVVKVWHKGKYIPKSEVPKRKDKSTYNMSFFKEAFALMPEDEMDKQIALLHTM